MRRFLILLSILAFVGVSRGQEFKLKLTYTVDGSPWLHPLYLGFDPTASDSFDSPARWAMPEYPEGMVEVPSNDFGDVDCRFSGRAIDRVNLGSGCYIDIRKKPASGGFELKYEVDLIANVASSAKLTWDVASIPPIIKHIYISSSERQDRFVLDMTETGEFNIPMDTFKLGKYRQTILTLLYNQDSLAVASNAIGDGISVYPTVLAHNAAAYVQTAEGGEYATVLVDAMGRQVASSSLTFSVGTNRLPVSFADRPAGAYTLVFRELHSGSIRTCKLIVE